MNVNRYVQMIWLVLFLSAIQLSAQQTNADRSFQEIKAKAEKGDAAAQDDLGEMYLDGKGVAQNYEEAVKWLRKSANQGNAGAQFNLGFIYENGASGPGGEVTKDVAEAAKWLRMAAEQGDSVSALALTRIYESGTNEADAIKWFREAAGRGYVSPQFLAIRENAGKGDAQAEWMLGQIYSGRAGRLDVGNGVPIDFDDTISVKWYHKAAEQGFAQAQFDLACQLAYRDKNPNEGIKWLRKAAVSGLAEAQTLLGDLCLDASSSIWKNVVPNDASEAVRWLDKAAEQGDAQAQGELGACYFRGQGTTKDYVQAYKWIDLASAQTKNVPIFLSGLEQIMTAEQIAQGQQLARDFKPRKALELGKVTSGDDILDSNPSATGTGFFITEDGYLISNYHVVKDAAQIRLVTGAGTIPAKVVQVDAANDLALLKADGHFALLPIISSRAAKLGGTVATVGFPDPGLQGFAPKLAKGEIASLSGAGDDARYFQISAPVQPGNSGGALVDMEGNVVGIVSAKLNAAAALAASGALPENVNYAVKSSFLLSFLQSLPAVEAKLKPPNIKEEKFEKVVKQAQAATVLVLVY